MARDGAPPSWNKQNVEHLAAIFLMLGRKSVTLVARQSLRSGRALRGPVARAMTMIFAKHPLEPHH
jgi:hypothetical protein